MKTAIDINRLVPAWAKLREVADIGPIRNEAHYLRMSRTLESLLELAAGDETHPAMSLIDIMGELIEDYEARKHPLPKVSGVQALKFLMAQHGLRQSDLQDLGSQGVVSEILAGKRDLNIRQVRRLSDRFGVSPATFI